MKLLTIFAIFSVSLPCFMVSGRQSTCRIGRKTYRGGNRFIPDTCEGYCRCDGRGGYSCTSLCAPIGMNCRSGQKLIYTAQTLRLNRKCSCRTPKCVSSRRPSTCRIGRKTYRGGKRFIPDTCEGYCNCNGGGGYSCTSLCPPIGMNCRPGQKLIYTAQKVRLNPKCSCRTPKCVSSRHIRPSTCRIGGKIYSGGKRFIPDNCEGYCQCSGRGGYSCTSLCAPTGMNCLLGQKLISVKQRLRLNPKCWCRRPKCVTNMRIRPTGCKVSGKLYRPGQSFISRNCREKCKCNGPGYGCTPLCSQPRCPKGKRAIIKRQLVSRIPRCYCRRVTRCL